MKTIGDILTGRAPVTLTPGVTVLEAVQRMQAERVGAILVVDPKGKLVGCFTERDLMTRVLLADSDPKEVTLRDTMTTELFTASPDDRINVVASEMQARHIRHLPVQRDGELLGMLSLRDILREHLDLKRDEVRALTSYIQGEGEA